MGDETLGPVSAQDAEREDIVAPRPGNARARKALLQVDSAGLAALSLDDEADPNRRLTALEVERKALEEAAMARALLAVERSRLEMQRAQERVEYREPEGVVKKKKKKVRMVAVGGDGEGRGVAEGGEGGAEGEKVKKRRKKKGRPEGDAEAGEGIAGVVEGGEGAGEVAVDERVGEIMRLATARGLPIAEATRADLDRMTDHAVHQGVADTGVHHEQPQAGSLRAPRDLSCRSVGAVDEHAEQVPDVAVARLGDAFDDLRLEVADPGRLRERVDPRVVRPVLVLARRGRVDHAGDVTRAGEHEA